MNKKYFLLDTNSLSSLTKSQDIHHEKMISKLDALNDDVELYASIITMKWNMVLFMRRNLN
jgi:hypothetical protein